MIMPRLSLGEKEIVHLCRLSFGKADAQSLPPRR